MSSDYEFGELKIFLSIDIVVLGVIDGSLIERILRKPNLTLEQAMALEQSAQ